MASSILRFTLVFIAISIAVPVALFAVKSLLNIDFSSSFVPFIPFLGAAQYEGQRFAREFGEKPTGGEAWLAACIMGLVGMGIHAVYAVLFFLALPELIEPLRTLPFVFLAIGFGVMLTFAILICRVFVGLGARSHLKNARRV